MKTLEEAIESAATVTTEDDIGLKVRNADDLAHDVMQTPVAFGYVMSMVKVCLHQWALSENSEDPLNVVQSMAFTAFVNGVRVGLEMNSRQEDHVPQ